MTSKSARLDRFLSARTGIKRGDVRLLLARGRVRVDGAVARDINQLVGPFNRIDLDGAPVQDRTPVYLMLHKPTGVVSATRDRRHPTVLDLVDPDNRDGLHIAGRLDFNSSGLLLLTNDGAWSRRLSDPRWQIPKRYLVTLERPLTAAAVAAFAEGFYFPYEKLTTRPAGLRILGDHTAEVTLMEGRYHQIKRMFGRLRNRVLALHRVAVGTILLDPALEAGQHRQLTAEEVEQTPGSPRAAPHL